jgi:hypothetical protein
MPKFNVGDLATFNYNLSKTAPQLWSCVVTKVNSASTYDVRFDGITVPEGTKPGCPGPQMADEIRAYESQLTARHSESGDELKAAAWTYKVKAWTLAQAAERAARDAAWHEDMTTRFGHIVRSRLRIPVSWTHIVTNGFNEGSVTENGFLLATDPQTFVGTVEFPGDVTKAVPISELTF